RALRDGRGGPDGADRPARSGEAQAGQPDRGPRDAELHHASAVERGDPRARRVPTRSVARSGRSSLLRLSHHGGARYDLHRAERRGGLAPGKRAPRDVPPDPLGAAPRRALPFHRQYRGLDDRGAGTATLAHLRPRADGRRRLAERLRGEHALHADRFHGDVHRSGDPLPLPDLPRARSRARRARAGSPRPGPSEVMPALWFCLVAFMLAGYTVLDGFDLGAGIIHLAAARTDGQRKQILKSIGPVWDGNEVWLIA